MAKYGTPYMERSPDGMYLSSASCIKLAQLAVGKLPPEPIARAAPKEPVMGNGKSAKMQFAKATQTYEAALVRHVGLYERQTAEYDEFVGTKFLWAYTRLRGTTSFDGQRIVAESEYKGEPAYTDIVTGAIFRKDGTCYSSSNLYLHKVGRVTSLAERKTYLKNRKAPDDE
jgi:hypothetical protein